MLVHCSNWLGVARLPQLYAAAGATVHVLCVPGAFIAQTRFASEVLNGSPDPEAMCSILQRHLEEYGDRYAAVVATEEGLLEALARRSGESWVARCLPYARGVDPGVLGLAVSKSAFLRACMATDIPVPATTLCDTLEEAERAADGIGYPVVVKCDRGTNGSGVAIAADAVQLKRAFASFAAHGTVAIQRLLRGRVGATDVIFQDGVPLCWSSFYKETIWPEPAGPAALRRYADPPGIEVLARRIGAMTRFHGLAVFCWVEDEADGMPRILELNFRPGPGPSHRGPVRTLFAGGLAALLRGSAYAGPRSPECSGAVMNMFPQALHRAIARHDYLALASWIPGLPSASDLPIDDAPLLRAHIRFLVGRLIARLHRRQLSSVEPPK